MTFFLETQKFMEVFHIEPEKLRTVTCFSDGMHLVRVVDRTATHNVRFCIAYFLGLH